MADLSQIAVKVALARAAAGIRERGGRNRGPEVDSYARAVGLDPVKGYAWCTSGLYDVFREASEQVGVANPFPRTAKAVVVFARAPQAVLRTDPAVGFVYVLDHGKPGDVATEWRTNRYKDDGHIGIVTAVDQLDQVLDEVSGNTNAAGSREGDRWAVHHGTPEVSHGGVLLGYLDMDAWARLVTR